MSGNWLINEITPENFKKTVVPCKRYMGVSMNERVLQLHARHYGYNSTAIIKHNISSHGIMYDSHLN